jgi:hypothetical protein
MPGSSRELLDDCVEVAAADRGELADPSRGDQQWARSAELFRLLEGFAVPGGGAGGMGWEVKAERDELLPSGGGLQGVKAHLAAALGELGGRGIQAARYVEEGGPPRQSTGALIVPEEDKLDLPDEVFHVHLGGQQLLHWEIGNDDLDQVGELVFGRVVRAVIPHRQERVDVLARRRRRSTRG